MANEKHCLLFIYLIAKAWMPNKSRPYCGCVVKTTNVFYFTAYPLLVVIVPSPQALKHGI